MRVWFNLSSPICLIFMGIFDFNSHGSHFLLYSGIYRQENWAFFIGFFVCLCSIQHALTHFGHLLTWIPHVLGQTDVSLLTQTGVSVPVLLFHQASAPHKCVYSLTGAGQKEMSEGSEYPRLEGIIKPNSYPGLGQPPEPQQVNIVQMLPDSGNCLQIVLTSASVNGLFFIVFACTANNLENFTGFFLVTWIAMCSLEVSWTERKEKLNWNTFQMLSVNASVVNDDSLPLTRAVFIV